MRFFWSILLPLSRSNIVALAIILFLYGWNQYLWPLLFTTDKNMATAVIGVKNLLPRSDTEPTWNLAMMGALLAMLPPVIVVAATAVRLGQAVGAEDDRSGIAPHGVLLGCCE